MDMSYIARSSMMAAAAMPMTLAALDMVSRIVTRGGTILHLKYIAAAALNAAIFMVIGQTCSSAVSPLAAIPLFSLLLAAELRLTSDAQPRLQLYLMLMVTLVHATMLSFVKMTLGIYGNFASSYELPISMLLSALCIAVISRSRSIHVEQLADLLYSKERGALIYVYTILCVISTLTTIKMSGEFIPSAFGIDTSVALERLIAISIKDVLTLISCMIISMLQGKNESRFRMNNILFGNISKGREFLRLAHGRVIFSYSANITKNTIDENIGSIKPEFASHGNYTDVLRKFIDRVVHPADRAKVEEVTTSQFHTMKLEGNPTYSIRFRISPAGMLKMLDLPEDTKVKYSSTTKEWAYIATNSIIVLDDMNGDVYVYVYMLDVDADMSQYEDMRHSATFDALTGISNRSALERTIGAALRNPSHSGSLFIIDLDNFKSINDILGHPAGDRALCETAEQIKAEFRSADIIGRLGGDEFMAFSIGIVDAEAAARKAARLVERGRRDVPVPDGEPIHLSFSVGVALFPAHGTDYRSLYQAADTALYESKTNGKDQFTIYSPEELKR